MSCTGMDLKAYVVGELAGGEKAAVEDHARVCQGCREELERLNLTHTALLSLGEEEIPQRIAFVSDKVFEPRWWQTMWRSGPAMGLASAALLAAAIVVHGFARPAATAPPADSAQMERRIQQEVDARVAASVAQAVSAAQAKQAGDFARELDATEKRLEAQRQTDLATVREAAEYYEKQLNRWLVASNDTRTGQ